MSILSSIGRGKGFTNVKPAFIPLPDNIQVPYVLTAGGALFPVLPTVKLFQGSKSLSTGTPQTVLTCDTAHYTVITGIIVISAAALGYGRLLYNGAVFANMPIAGNTFNPSIIFPYPGILIDLGTTNVIAVDNTSGAGAADITLLGYQPAI